MSEASTNISTRITSLTDLHCSGSEIGIFLDTETSGLDPQKHVILEIAFKLVDMVRGKIIGSYQSIADVSPEEWQRASPEALKVNGFKWEDVVGQKPLKEIGSEIKREFENYKIDKENACYFCQNPTFDRAFFTHIFSEEEQCKNQWPYHWLDLASINWGLEMQRYVSGESKEFRQGGFSKDKIAARHGLPPEDTPHRAMNGVDHLLEIYRHIVGFRGVSSKG